MLPLETSIISRHKYLITFEAAGDVGVHLTNDGQRCCAFDTANLIYINCINYFSVIFEHNQTHLAIVVVANSQNRSISVLLNFVHNNPIPHDLNLELLVICPQVKCNNMALQDSIIARYDNGMFRVISQDGVYHQQFSRHNLSMRQVFEEVIFLLQLGQAFQFSIF